MDQVFTMIQGQKELEIRIGIIDDPDWEPDEDFTVKLIDENTKERIVGDDTECTVLILDEDKPGNIGFEETSISVQRKDRVAFVNLKRNNGCDGTISCTIDTVSDVASVPGKAAAIEGKDFIAIKG